MKKLAISALSAIALTVGALGGQPMASGKDYKAVQEPCINDVEFQLDIFGSYSDSRSDANGDGFGGGIALNYFFMRYVGVGVEGNLYDGDANGVWNVGGRLIFRYPIDASCLVPYAFVAGGAQASGETVATVGLGGGLEYRLIPQKLGLFGEGRYNWADENSDSAQVRFGVRVVF